MASKPKYDSSSRTKIKLTDEIIEEIDKLISENEKNRLLGRTKQLMKKVDYTNILLIKDMISVTPQLVTTLKKLMIKRRPTLDKNMISEIH